MKKEKKEKIVKEEVQKSPMLMSYTIKAVIPTGPYANIQPEIVVLADTLEQAKEYVMPHIDMLYETYLNISERPKPKITVKTTEPVEAAKVITPPKVVETPPEPEKEVVPLVSEAYEKAKLAIDSCFSIPALDLIADRVEKSVKLNNLEKMDLKLPISTKRAELHAKQSAPIA